MVKLGDHHAIPLSAVLNLSLSVTIEPHLSSFSSLMVAIIPTFLWGWPGEAWHNWPDRRLSLYRSWEFGPSAADSSPTLHEEHRRIFNIHQLMPADGTPSLTSI